VKNPAAVNEMNGSKRRSEKEVGGDGPSTMIATAPNAARRVKPTTVQIRSSSIAPLRSRSNSGFIHITGSIVGTRVAAIFWRFVDGMDNDILMTS
jgi:hypothetical protein